MASKCFSLVRGRVLRATALDACGRPKSAAAASVVTSGFISVAFTANTDTGDEISVTNASGAVCIRDTPCPTFTGYGVEITFCDVNPELYALISGSPVIFDSNGDAVGFRVNSDVSACDFGVALELWSNVAGIACGATGGSYGYILVPFLQGGVLGDFTLENDAVTFSITGANTKAGSGWGTGPATYLPINGAGGTPAALSRPIDAGDHLHVQYTTVAPPTAACAATSSGAKASTAAVGSPGTWGPANSYAPKNLSDATGVTATPATAWTATQYMVTADNNKIKWSGTAWAQYVAP